MKAAKSLENIMKCLCPQCPVQANSACIKEKVQKGQELIKMIPPGFNPPAAMIDASTVPGLYCSTGKASCTDIDFSQACICGKCPLWTECQLDKGKPAGYYCRDGASE